MNPNYPFTIAAAVVQDNLQARNVRLGALGGMDVVTFVCLIAVVVYVFAAAIRCFSLVTNSVSNADDRKTCWINDIQTTSACTAIGCISVSIAHGYQVQSDRRHSPAPMQHVNHLKQECLNSSTGDILFQTWSGPVGQKQRLIKSQIFELIRPAALVRTTIYLGFCNGLCPIHLLPHFSLQSSEPKTIS